MPAFAVPSGLTLSSGSYGAAPAFSCACGCNESEALAVSGWFTEP